MEIAQPEESFSKNESNQGPEIPGYVVVDSFVGPGATAAPSSGGCAAGGTGAASPVALWLLAGLIGILFCVRRQGTRRFAGLSALVVVLISTSVATGRDGAARLTDLKRVTNAGDYEQPIWSPDGESIAFAGQHFSALYVVPASGGKPMLVARGRSAGYEPVWFSDGKILGFRRPGQRMSEVPAMAVRVDGKAAACAPVNPSPGIWIRVRGDHVYLREGRTQRLISRTDDKYFAARLSTDERSIAFQGLTTGVWVYDIKSDSLMNLGEGNHPRFSLDGKTLVFDRCTDDGARLLACKILISDLDAPEPVARPVIGTPPLARYPSLSPDGAHLTFESKGAIWTARLR
ncbi:MAG: hypothetical protein GXP54_06315 [Deltaproteobacteria bacterium]|nr:hypothetical protein [Deltaproteobacteria bacterium]